MSRNQLVFHDDILGSKLDHELIRNPPYELTLTIEELTKPSNRKRGEHDSLELKVPRPPNGYILYRKDFWARIKLAQPNLRVQDVSKMSAQQWEKESCRVKLFFKILAEIQGENHNRKYPGYKYNPKNNRGNDKKRRHPRPKSKKQIGQDTNKSLDLTSFSQPFEAFDLRSLDLSDSLICDALPTTTPPESSSFEVHQRSAPQYFVSPRDDNSDVGMRCDLSLYTPLILDLPNHDFYPNLAIDSINAVQPQLMFTDSPTLLLSSPVVTSSTDEVNYHDDNYHSCLIGSHLQINDVGIAHTNDNPLQYDPLTPCVLDADALYNLDIQYNDWPGNY
ncbi:14376_t:CDS:1 [Acaulospora colombiana]|uniref:14376_t:CDS:1 n=1 Tax=Acaulospora colombiana TaxID=27376 RepID=A0ACA9LSF4_9GLOM|nr:14376_t:CDS:1 [Acaulospora colombiana]